MDLLKTYGSVRTDIINSNARLFSTDYGGKILGDLQRK